MKIEITAAEGANGYKIYKDGHAFPTMNFRRHFVDQFSFEEDDILNLLGNQYKAFERGKYQFKVTASRLKLITGERSAMTKDELIIYPL